MHTWNTAPTKSVGVNGDEFAYRELGPRGERPVIFLTYLTAVLDDWDPRIIDGIAEHRHVIAFDNRGVGGSTGSTPTTVDEMAADAVAFIDALGYDDVDLFGFSLGGMIAQLIAESRPKLVHRMILAGTGPSGDARIAGLPRVFWGDVFRGVRTRNDPRVYLFYPHTEAGKADGRAFIDRLGERTEGRDAKVKVGTMRAQLKALKGWASRPAQDLSKISQPALVVNGDDDRMIPTDSSRGLARRLPNSELVIYPSAGHGGIFQYGEVFVASVLAFLGDEAVAPLQNA